MTTEDLLRDTLRAEADKIQPRDGWAAIESRFGESVRRSRMRLLTPLAAAAAIVLVFAAAVALRDPKRPLPVLTNPGDTTTSTSTTPTTSRTVETVPVDAAPKYIWPIDASRSYSTPEAMAAAYAHEFLGVSDATVGTFRRGDTTSGEIDVRTSFGNVISTLLARQEADGSWHALEAMNPNLVIGNPHKGETITSPQKITGRSVAFEGVVHVSLYGYGTVDGKHPLLATATFTGHGTELAPYETSISWPPTDAKWGLLMLWTDSARDGTLAEASVRLYRLG